MIACNIIQLISTPYGGKLLLLVVINGIYTVHTFDMNPLEVAR